MRNSLLALLYSIFSATGASAEVDCALVNSLTRLAEAPLNYESWPEDGLPPDDLQSEMRRFDAANISNLFRNYPDADARADLAALARITARLSNHADRGEGGQIYLLLNAPRVQQVFRDAGRVLDRMGCNGVSVSLASSSGQDSAQEAQDKIGAEASNAQQQSLPLPAGTILTIAAVILTAFVSFGFILWRRKLKRKARRARRYSIRQTVLAETGEVRFYGRLIDISCNGLKFRHYGQLQSDEPTTMRINISGRWYEVKPQWRNEHYAGLVFKSPLRFSALLSILSGVNALAAPSKQRMTQKNGADTAPSS